MRLRHSMIDQALVDRAVQLGALAPTFTRDSHPTLWREWDLAACRLCAVAQVYGDINAARAACDLKATLSDEPAENNASSGNAALAVLDMLGVAIGLYLMGALA